ncbi:MAG: hypothetical protein V4501_07225 [Pseudomonadota bacterium]
MNSSRNFFANFSDLTSTNFTSQNMTSMQIANTANRTFSSLSNTQLIIAGIVFFGLLGAVACYLEKSWVRVHSFMHTRSAAAVVTEYELTEVSAASNEDATKLIKR